MYPRQSNPSQVEEHTGSRDFQLALVEVSRRLGFQDHQITVADGDLGKSGTSTRNRKDWNAMVKGIEAGRIRVVVVSEISRLGRDIVDLLRFIKLCEAKGVLLWENDKPRDVRNDSDWFLTVIIAAVAEQENRQRKTRSMRGLLTKARQGTLVTRLPMGFERTEDGSVVKTSNTRVRDVIIRIWREALQNRSIHATVRGLFADGVEVPVWGRNVHKRQIVWRPATIGRVLQILTNPVYAGWIVLWRHRTEPGREKGRVRRITPAEQEWLEGRIEAYVTLEEFQRVQEFRARRRPRTEPPIARGRALCQGLAVCGTHQRRLSVNYISEKYGRGASHRYMCPACNEVASRPTDRPPCGVGGKALDQLVEDIVLAGLRCPSPAKLRQVIREENERRRTHVRLLDAQAHDARRLAAELEACVENSQRAGHANVTQRYMDKLTAALDKVREADQRRATTPLPSLIDDSNAFVAEVAATFRNLPRLWRSARLGDHGRKEIVRQVVDRIVVFVDPDYTARVQISLHSGQVLKRVLYSPRARGHLMKALATEGHDAAWIAAELNRRVFRNLVGEPYVARAVRTVIGGETRVQRSAPPPPAPTPVHRRAEYRQAATDALCALWAQALSGANVAERLNAQGLLTPLGKPWTKQSVAHMAKQLHLTLRWRVQLKALRAPLTELIQAGWEDAAIAEELNARGVTGYSGRSWMPSRVRRARLVLGLHRPTRRRSTATSQLSVGSEAA